MDEIYQAPLYKRIVSSLLDIIVTTLLSIGVFMLLINGAIDIGFHNLDYKIEQYKLEESSDLFNVKKDSEGNIIEIINYIYNKEDKTDYKRFLEKIHNYYIFYVDSELKTEEIFNKEYLQFDEKTLKNAIFQINSINDNYQDYVLLDDIKDVTTNKIVNKNDEQNYYEAIEHFFMDDNKGIYPLALTEFTNSDKFQKLVNELAFIERIEIMICVALATLIFISLPTLLNKNGETSFMHLLNICFVDSYGYKVKWRNKMIRAILIIVLNASSSYLFGIPLVINALIFILTPLKRSAIDYASNMTAIDKKTSIIIE